MNRTALADDLAEERAVAIRTLLAAPLLDAGNDVDAFRLVARHHSWLTEWFETSCGWRLTLDASAGFARLAKRPADAIDLTRPLRRSRSRTGAAFDRRRYQLLCLICAELARHPVTTVGLLARAVTAEASLESSRRSERSALVDALLTLIGWGVLSNSAGDVEAYIDDSSSNAILSADTTRLHHLLVSSQAASGVEPDCDVDTATRALLAEPRYGAARVNPSEADEQQRLRWARHSLARRLLDDPVVALDGLTGAERDYVSTSSGRRWLRERVGAAGFVLEERADGLMAVDPSAIATDLTFPSPLGNAYQFALLLIDQLVRFDGDGSRQLVELNPDELNRLVDTTLTRYPGWANAHRDGDGPQRLIDQAAELLIGFGLCHRTPEGALVPHAAAARYRIGEPTVSAGQGSLFEESP